MGLNSSSFNSASFSGEGELVVRISVIASQAQGAEASSALAISCSGASSQVQTSENVYSAQSQSSIGDTALAISCAGASSQAQKSAVALDATVSFTSTSTTIVLQLPTGGFNYGGFGSGSFNGATSGTNFTVAINSVSQTQTFSGYGAQFVGGAAASEQCESASGVMPRTVSASCSSEQVQGIELAATRTFPASSETGQVQGSEGATGRAYEVAAGSSQAQTTSVSISRTVYFSSEDGLVQSVLGTLPRIVLGTISAAQAGQSILGTTQLDVQAAAATDQVQSGIGTTQRDLSGASESSQVQAFEATASRLVEGVSATSQVQAQTSEEAMLRTMRFLASGSQTQRVNGDTSRSLGAGAWETSQVQRSTVVTEREVFFTNADGVSQRLLGTFSLLVEGNIVTVQSAQSALGSMQRDVHSTWESQQAQIQEGSVLLLSGEPSIFIAYVPVQNHTAIVPA